MRQSPRCARGPRATCLVRSGRRCQSRNSCKFSSSASTYCSRAEARTDPAQSKGFGECNLGFQSRLGRCAYSCVLRCCSRCNLHSEASVLFQAMHLSVEPLTESCASVLVVGTTRNDLDKAIVVGDTSLASFALEKPTVQCCTIAIERSRCTVRMAPRNYARPTKVQTGNDGVHAPQTMTGERVLLLCWSISEQKSKLPRELTRPVSSTRARPVSGQWSAQSRRDTNGQRYR